MLNPVLTSSQSCKVTKYKNDQVAYQAVCECAMATISKTCHESCSLDYDGPIAGAGLVGV